MNASFTSVSESAGYGRHAAYLQPHDVVIAFKYLILSEAAAILSLTFSKMSISVLLLYLLHGARGQRKKAFLLFTMGLLLVTALISLVLMLAQCQPASKIWNPAIPGSCKDPRLQSEGVKVQGGELWKFTRNNMWLTWLAIVTAALVDFALAAFPVIIVKDLQLSTRKKIVLTALMSLGVL